MQPMKPGETIKIECDYCRSQYALTYWPDSAKCAAPSTQAYPAYPDVCPFCGEEHEDSDFDSDIDSDLDN